MIHNNGEVDKVTRFDYGDVELLRNLEVRFEDDYVARGVTERPGGPVRELPGDHGAVVEDRPVLVARNVRDNRGEVDRDIRPVGVVHVAEIPAHRRWLRAVVRFADDFLEGLVVRRQRNRGVIINQTSGKCIVHPDR
jgi:hypothetical protein